MGIAGVWQVNRHTERADRNDQIEARSALDVAPVRDVIGLDAQLDGDGTDRDGSIGEVEQFRRVSATGEYLVEDEVLVRNRTFEGAPGSWVLTPFLLDDGSAVVVNRGWIPRVYTADGPRDGTEPATGVQTIEGTIQPARVASGIQQSDPATGRLSSLARPDIARLAQQLDYDVLPVVLQLDAEPANSVGLPRPLPLPALDGGPHISYAVQWFVFTTIAVVGYPLILRRVASGRSESAPEE